MTAARKLSPAIPDDDPLWQKFLAAPVDHHPVSEQEMLELQQAKQGDFVDGATVSAEIAVRAPRKSKGPRGAP